MSVGARHHAIAQYASPWRFHRVRRRPNRLILPVVRRVCAFERLSTNSIEVACTGQKHGLYRGAREGLNREELGCGIGASVDDKMPIVIKWCPLVWRGGHEESHAGRAGYRSQVEASCIVCDQEVELAEQGSEGIESRLTPEVEQGGVCRVTDLVRQFAFRLAAGQDHPRVPPLDQGIRKLSKPLLGPAPEGRAGAEMKPYQRAQTRRCIGGSVRRLLPYREASTLYAFASVPIRIPPILPPHQPALRTPPRDGSRIGAGCRWHNCPNWDHRYNAPNRRCQE